MGATNAVEAGQNPDTIRKVGRWKSKETFENHYVHAKPSPSFTDSLFKLQKASDIKIEKN